MNATRYIPLGLALLLFLIPDTGTAAPQVDAKFFNGRNLTGWSAAEMKYWSVKNGVIVGHADQNVPKNEFLWSEVVVKDFYLAVDVKLTPANRNAGIQFRSQPINSHGQALGYQADVGSGVWGKLYHEHGRKKLDWNTHADKVVQHGEWNRYEILAVGHRVWTAINGTLCVAIDDPKGELSGKIALQIHSGPPQNVQYRIRKLIHDPELALEKQSHAELIAALSKTKEPTKTKPTTNETPTERSAWNDEVRRWRSRLDANDPGMQSKWFAHDAEDSNWKLMKLPNYHERAGLPGHDGTVWFRRSIRLTAEKAAKEHSLNLGPIDDMDMAWVNGVQVGGIEVPGYWLKPRSYRVPANLLRPDDNVIVVRVIDHGWSGGFAGSAKQMNLTTQSDAPVPLAGNWRFHAGVTLKSLGLGSLTNPRTTPAVAQVTTTPQTIEVPEILRPLAKPTAPRPAFTDGFQIEGDQTIAIFGGSNAAESQRNGWLEMRLISAHAKHEVRLRNLAWPADTIYQQPRPRNFFGQTNPSYGEKDGRQQITADIAILWFGQMESLDGPSRLPEFRSSYEDLIAQVSRFTKRIVLVTPVPFGDPLGLGLNVGARNVDLQKYATAIRAIAAQRKLPLVDLTSILQRQNATADGALLSDDGHRKTAVAFAKELGFQQDLPDFSNYLRETIREKNTIWRRYWLPSNWAFLYGNRQSQPSSRDHRNKAERWFPKELENFRQQTLVLEKQIQNRLHNQ